jgi:type I restriction enzyme R subunit
LGVSGEARSAAIFFSPEVFVVVALSIDPGGVLRACFLSCVPHVKPILARYIGPRNPAWRRQPFCPGHDLGECRLHRLIDCDDIMGLIQSDAKFMDEREDIAAPINTLKAGEGLRPHDRVAS